MTAWTSTDSAPTGTVPASSDGVPAPAASPSAPREDRMTAPHFPALHRVHPLGWINDPNGIVRVDGRWHVYFQHNPFSARHERIHWGHMSSPDLVSWREEPLGPVPRPGEADRGGCWSGVATREGGREGAALVYSGVDDMDVQLSQVVVARTDAALEHLTEPGHVAAGVPEGLDLLGIRDPFLVELDGRRWAIQGAGLRDRTDEQGQERVVPALLLFDATDLDHWEYRGPLLTGEDILAAQHAPADIWECPQLVEVDGRWVLLLSLWLRPEKVARSTVQVNYLVGDLVTDEATGLPRFVPEAGGRADLGPDFYAPQAVVDAAGERVLAWGWSWEGLDRIQQQTDEQGWAGCLTFPRELGLVGDRLVMRAPRELEALRGAELPTVPAGGSAVSGEGASAAVGASRPDGVAGEVLDLPAPFRAEVELTGAATVELHRADGRVETVIEHPGGAARLLTDGGILELLPAADTPSTVRLYPEADDTLTLRGHLGRAWELRLPA